MKRPLPGRASWYENWVYFVHPSYTMSAWNQGAAPDALTTCIPAAGACIVHTSYQPAQFKYFAVLLNFSSTFSPDPFQMCEPQAKWGGSKLHSYVLITHRPGRVWAHSTVHAYYLSCDKYTLWKCYNIAVPDGLCPSNYIIRQTVVRDIQHRYWITSSWSYGNRHLLFRSTPPWETETWTNFKIPCILEGIIHHKMNTLSTFTHPHVNPNHFFT